MQPQTIVPVWLARLEFLRVCAHHAEDADSLSPQDLVTGLADETWVTQSMQLHPSLHVFSAPYAATSIWQAHQQEKVECEHVLQHLNLETSEQCVVFRSGVDAWV